MRFFALLGFMAISSYALAQNQGPVSADSANPVVNDAGPERIHLDVGGGLALYNGSVAKAYNYDLGKLGFTFDFNVGWRVSDSTPLYLGLETGVYYWGVTATYSTGLVHDVSAYALPLLPRVTYQFEFSPKVHPYLSVSAGPSLYVETQNFSDTTADTSKTRIVFEALVHPGLNLNFGKHFGLNIDPKLGTLDGTFIFLSSVGALFRF